MLQQISFVFGQSTEAYDIFIMRLLTCSIWDFDKSFFRTVDIVKVYELKSHCKASHSGYVRFAQIQ